MTGAKLSPTIACQASLLRAENSTQTVDSFRHERSHFLRYLGTIEMEDVARWKDQKLWCGCVQYDGVRVHWKRHYGVTSASSMY